MERFYCRCAKPWSELSCISLTFVCDGDDDCGNNSDEEANMCREIQYSNWN